MLTGGLAPVMGVVGSGVVVAGGPMGPGTVDSSEGGRTVEVARGGSC